MGHIGLTPQSVHAAGGYKVQGRDLGPAKDLIADASALAEAGAFSIVLEGVPDALAALVTESVPVPTIGIGAGPATDGQVLVFHDVLGLHEGRMAKFVRTYASLFDDAVGALERFFADVRSGAFPSADESYAMPPEVVEQLREGGSPSTG
jgi:3-methyl-2-oxobutanoate hydroxymethyltransferase